jgi:hypothetical protein
MKRLITIGILLIGMKGYGQTMEKEYLNYVVNKRNAKVYRTKETPFEYIVVPKTKTVRIKGDKVIVTYDKREWVKAQYINKTNKR